MRGCFQFGLVAVCLAFVSCDSEQEASVSAPESVSAVKEYLNLPISPFRYDQGPPDEIIQLGRVLFYDKSLSVNNSISCGSCHKQRYAFADSIPFSNALDGGVTTRNTMSLMDARNGGLIKTSSLELQVVGGLFWDGRSPSLFDAVSRPITNHIEMGMTDMTAVAEKLSKIPYYPELFATAYGDSRVINAFNIQRALEYFVLALDSRTTRFQQHERGLLQFTNSEILGMQLFTEKYDCGSCHEKQLGADVNRPQVYGSGGGQTVVGFANIGLPETDDKGLYGYIQQLEYTGLFKIPSLNNVALTAPYMHDGSLATLEDVLDHYSDSIRQAPNLDARLRDEGGSAKRMDISAEEKKAIIDFLKTFTDEKMANAAEFSNPFKKIQ